jgi:hypothetical protein
VHTSCIIEADVELFKTFILIPGPERERERERETTHTEKKGEKER